MRRTQRLFALISILALLASSSLAQDPIKQNKKPTVAPAAASNPVVGSGAAGQITKWLGFDGSNTYSIGDSNITEDKFGNVGIGTRTPTSSLTVRGSIETTLGGFKFPDGTSQTTAGIASAVHDATLQGNGTLASPLGVAVPLNLSGSSAVVFKATNSGAGEGVRGISDSGSGVRGIVINGNGVSGSSDNGTGVRGFAVIGDGVLGEGGSDGVRGRGPVGVRGESTSGIGVSGEGDSGTGVRGASFSGTGVRGVSVNGSGVQGQGGTNTGGGGGAGVVASGGSATVGVGGTGVLADGGISSSFIGGDAIHAIRGSGNGGLANGRAGSFVGDVDVQGTLTKTMGTFKIDHPLDPENKYLYHSFVESPDMMNIYNGNITTDPNGEAVVEMPNYFDALNKDFRYQLTVIGTFAQAIVAAEMKDNRFIIKTDAPGVKVSWMVTGVRQDAYAEKNRVKVEELKAERERGYYIHPEVFNQPEEKSIEWALNPELMQKLKQQRLEVEKAHGKQEKQQR